MSSIIYKEWNDRMRSMYAWSILLRYCLLYKQGLVEYIHSYYIKTKLKPKTKVCSIT